MKKVGTVFAAKDPVFINKVVTISANMWALFENMNLMALRGKPLRQRTACEPRTHDVDFHVTAKEGPVYLGTQKIE